MNKPSSILDAVKQASQQHHAGSRTPAGIPSDEAQLKNELNRATSKTISGSTVNVKRRLIHTSDIEKLVVVHPLNRRNQKYLEHENTKDLINDIKANNGVINEPITCYYDGEKFYAIDGSRRRMSAIKGGFDLPIEYFTEELPPADIKAFIKSTLTGKDNSDIEVFLILKEDIADLYRANIDTDKKTLHEMEFELMAEAGISPNKTNKARLKKVFDHIHPDFFVNADINCIKRTSLYDMANYVATLKERDPSNSSTENLIALFNNAIEKVKAEYETYSGKEILFEAKRLRNGGSSAPISTHNPKVRTFIKNENCKIELIENAQGCRIVSNIQFPDALKSEIELLLSKHLG